MSYTSLLNFFLDFPQIVLKCTNIPQPCAHTYMWVLSVQPLPSLCSMSCPCLVLWHLPERHLSVIPLSTRLNSPFLFSKSFTSKHWATLSFALLSSSMGKSYLMLSSWLVLQNMISFPPGSNVHHPSHLQLLCGRNEACGRRCISVFWVLLYFCISPPPTGPQWDLRARSRELEVWGNIRRNPQKTKKQSQQRLIYRPSTTFLQKSPLPVLDDISADNILPICPTVCFPICTHPSLSAERN